MWDCEARRVLGVNPPFVRQTATKFLGLEAQDCGIYASVVCVHIKNGAPELRGSHNECCLQWSLQFPYFVIQTPTTSPTPTKVDIGGCWTPSILQPLQESFTTPMFSLSRTFCQPCTLKQKLGEYRYAEEAALKWKVLKMWDCAARTVRYAQLGIEPRTSYSTNKNQSIRPLNEVPELQGSHNFKTESSVNGLHVSAKLQNASHNIDHPVFEKDKHLLRKVRVMLMLSPVAQLLCSMV